MVHLKSAVFRCKYKLYYKNTSYPNIIKAFSHYKDFYEKIVAKNRCPYIKLLKKSLQW